MKKFLVSLSIVCFLSAFAFAEDTLQSMHDAFGRGFQAVKSKNKEEAVTWFKKAGNDATQAQEWRGCLDAGNALLKLGSPQDAAPLFHEAFQIGQSKNDWRISIASGYALASLPPDLHEKEAAIQAFSSATEEANKKNDWIGLTEAAKGLIHVGDTSHASQVLADTRKVVEATQNAKGAQVISDLYTQLGMAKEAEEMKAKKEKFEQAPGESGPYVEPPPGWSASGESVASPSIPSPEQQRMARESADKDIEAKNQYIAQQREIEVTREREANQYSSYYYYPYGYASYTAYEPWGWDLLTPWADTYAGYYTYRDGYYSYSGSYTGFGFAYGYADGNSSFGVSVFVSD
ncbi:MAG: hypothetical protein HYS08_08310 [Chlamydiae bacterium]|nr:hypothetical protein [Chlamydiota bacterium]MBI3265984.1 hypothetical protein [Chlamydiota bacterium]